MFARYLPLLKDKCKKVIFKPQSVCAQLFKDCGWDIQVLDKDDNEADLKYDVHVPIMSLPYLLKVNIPFNKGYLKSNPEKVEYYKKKYFDNDKFKVGINWHGNITFSPTRRIPLKEFYQLFGLNDFKFYSLQTGEGIEQLEDAKDFGIVDLSSTFKDFSDTAAAVENLDLLITNDTAVAHVAGALNKPCKVLLPFVQDWRWSDDLQNDWYESISSIKQQEPDDWKYVFEELNRQM
jgi:ADP-heptose:LPS heptosyltransferase